MNDKVINQYIEALTEEELLDEALTSLNSAIIALANEDNKVYASGEAVQILRYNQAILGAYRAKKYGRESITVI